MNPFKAPHPQTPAKKPRLSDPSTELDKYTQHSPPSDLRSCLTPPKTPPVSLEAHKPEPLGFCEAGQAQPLVVECDGCEIDVNQVLLFPPIKGTYFPLPRETWFSPPFRTYPMVRARYKRHIEQSRFAPVYYTLNAKEHPLAQLFCITPPTNYHVPRINPLLAEILSTEPLQTNHLSTNHLPTKPLPEKPISTEPHQTKHLPTNHLPTKPLPTESPSTEPLPTEPHQTKHLLTNHLPTKPLPEEPILTEPHQTNHLSTNHLPTNHLPTNHLPTKPLPTESPSTEPLPTEPLPTESPSTESLSTEPLPTEPLPIEPLPTEPLPTEPLSTEYLPTNHLPTEPPSTESLSTESLSTEPLPTFPTQVAEPIGHRPEEEPNLYARDEQNESTKAFVSSERSMCNSVMGTKGDKWRLELRRTRESTNDYLSNLSTAQLSRARDQSDTNRPAMFQDLSKELPVEYSGQSGENGGTDDEFESYRDECQSVAEGFWVNEPKGKGPQELYDDETILSKATDLSLPADLFRKYAGDSLGVGRNRLVSMSMIIRSQMQRSKEIEKANSNAVKEHQAGSDDDASTMTYHPPVPKPDLKDAPLKVTQIKVDKAGQYQSILSFRLPNFVTKTRKHPAAGHNGNQSQKLMNPYILFCSDWREIYQTENPNLSTRQLAAALGIIWRNLGRDQKEEYVRRAETIKKEAKGNLAKSLPAKPIPAPPTQIEVDRTKVVQPVDGSMNSTWRRNGLVIAAFKLPKPPSPKVPLNSS